MNFFRVSRMRRVVLVPANSASDNFEVLVARCVHLVPIDPTGSSFKNLGLIDLNFAIDAQLGADKKETS
jgi:hypothetical protein